MARIKAPPKPKLTLAGYVTMWVLGGIARQIGYDTRTGALNARNLFRVWVGKKWQRTPRVVRADLFALGVTARAGYRGVRYAGRTVRVGARYGAAEGKARYAERRELRELNQEFPGRRPSPLYEQERERIQTERARRRTEHRIYAEHTANAYRAARRNKTRTPPVPVPSVTTPTGQQAPGTAGPDPVTSVTPQAPGPKTEVGSWQLSYIADDGARTTLSGYTEDYARQLAAWWRWRASVGPGFGDPDSVRTSSTGVMPGEEPMMPCPDHTEKDCDTCGGEGEVPAWLADPAVHGEDAARVWGWKGPDPQPATAAEPAADPAPAAPTNGNGNGAALVDLDSLQDHSGTHNGTHSTNGAGTPPATHGKEPAMTAPTAPAAPATNTGGDITSIPDLRDLNERTGQNMAGVMEQQSVAAATLREQAAAYEAAVGGLASEGHDAQTISETSAALEAVAAAAAKAEEATVAAEAALAAVNAAYQGLERHRPLEEAVASHPGPAERTRAYMPR